MYAEFPHSSRSCKNKLYCSSALMHFIHNFTSECLMKCLRSSECDRSGKSSYEESASYSKVRGCGKYAIMMRCYAIVFSQATGESIWRSFQNNSVFTVYSSKLDFYRLFASCSSTKSNLN